MMKEDVSTVNDALYILLSNITMKEDVSTVNDALYILLSHIANEGRRFNSE